MQTGHDQEAKKIATDLFAGLLSLIDIKINNANQIGIEQHWLRIYCYVLCVGQEDSQDESPEAAWVGEGKIDMLENLANPEEMLRDYTEEHKLGEWVEQDEGLWVV